MFKIFFSILIIGILGAEASDYHKVRVQQYDVTAGSFGSNSIDSQGNIYISGTGTTLTKLNYLGEVLWTQIYADVENGYIKDIAIDPFDNILLAGYTSGSPDEIFLIKVDNNGTVEWVNQYGSNYRSGAEAVTTDSNGNIYLTGYTSGSIDTSIKENREAYEDIILSKFSTDGTTLWTRQYGSEDHDRGRSVITDIDNNIYLTGSTKGDMNGTNHGETDIFLSKVTSSGTILWTVQNGSSSRDSGKSIVIDNNNDIVITGDINENPSAPNVFISKYNNSGSNIWTEEFGANTNSRAFDLTVDENNDLFITGYTYGDLNGTNNGSSDVFLTKCDYQGNIAWTKQYGTTNGDYGTAIVTDSNNNIYVSGGAGGLLEGNDGLTGNTFLMKFSIRPSIDSISFSGETKEFRELTFSVDYTLEEDRTISSVMFNYLNNGNFIIDNHYTFTEEGVYTVNVKVTDDEGNAATSSIAITINELPYDERTYEQKLLMAIDPIYYDDIVSLIEQDKLSAVTASVEYVQNNPSEYGLVSESTYNTSVEDTKILCKDNPTECGIKEKVIVIPMF